MAKSLWSTQPQQRFWYFHLLYWLLYLLLKFTHIAVLVPKQGDQAWPFLLSYSVVTSLALLVTGMLGQHYLIASFSLAQQLKRLLYWLIPLFFALLLLRQRLLEFFTLDNSKVMSWLDILLGTSQLVFLPLAGWIAVYMLIKANQLYQREFIAQQALLNQARSARLKVLRYQLNPHFMFNTLNALNSLIVSRQGLQAEELIQHLSTFLRHSLKNKDDTQVPLPQELEALQAYLAIQQLRFGERLVLNWQVDALPGLQIPPLLLQPLAENAVLFTVAEHSGQVQLDIRLQTKDNELIIILCRSLDGTAQHNENQAWPASLSQLAERLDLMFGDKARLQLRLAGGAFYSELCLPLESLYVGN
jgi:sensor histidine kinase YesM